MDLKTTGILAALGSAFAWAAGAILFKKLTASFQPLPLTAIKGTISLLLFGGVFLFTGFQEINFQIFLILGLSGLLGIACGDTFFFMALQELDAHIIVLMGLLGQVLTVILAVILLHESPAITAWMGIILIICGVTIAMYKKTSDRRNTSSYRGIVYALLAVCCMSFAIIITKICLHDVAALEATFIRLLWGTTGVIIVGMLTGRFTRSLVPLKNPGVFGLLIGAVCIGTFGGFWLYHVALKSVDVTIANTLNSTEPLFVIPLAAFFLRENITRTAIMGALCAFCGTVLLCVG